MRGIALGVALIAFLLSVATLGVGRLTATHGGGLYKFAAADLVMGALFPAVGALVLVRQPRNSCGWVLLSAGLLSVSALAHQWLYDSQATVGSLPGVPVAAWLAAWTYAPYWLQPTLLPVLFPDGVAPSVRWRRFVVAVLVVTAVGTLAAMFKPDPNVEDLGFANPLGVGPSSTSAAWIAVQYGATTLLLFVATPLAIVGLLLRQRRAVGRTRAQLQWLLFGFISFLVLSIVALIAGPVENALTALALAAIPGSIAVAVMLHGLLDIELIVNRTIVYVLLSGAGLVAYVGLVAAAATFAPRESAGPVVAAVVVAVAALGRARLQQLVDRWLFGARRDPYEVVERVGARVSAAESPAEALEGLVSALRDALALPYVAVDPSVAGFASISSGRASAEVEELALVHRGRRIGLLRVGHRHRGESFRPEERSVLTDIARRASALVNTAALAADLQRSRERIVSAREEERRRLRRDLHDGLGPEMAGLALQLDSLAARLRADVDLAERAGRLRDRLQHAVVEVRRIVDGLRPAAVDELGLAEALRQLAAASDGAPVMTVVVPNGFPELPAAVEVAAYRIASEAVTNALRHASATHCSVRAVVENKQLVVEVRDDGRGFGAEATVGVGLESLHDRAAEVGGSLEVVSARDLGTTVTARLPLEPQ